MEKDENEMKGLGGSRTPRLWSGIILLAAGILLLAYKMGAPIPWWFFTWPVLLIGIGILTGIKSRFHNPGALILIVVGGVFLIDQTSPQLNFHNYILPVILIGAGLVYITRPRHTWGKQQKNWHGMDFHWDAPVTSPPAPEANESKTNVDNDSEYLEINAIFGSVKKIILSKNFTGGEINCFMGGAEINFMKADVQHSVSLEVNNIFGGTKLIVPSNWNVKNEVTAVFGGIEDKRNIAAGIVDPGKILVLKGNCLFGGIEITNY
jgi:predicted membrane protein